MEFRWVRLIALLVFGGSDIGVAIYGRYANQKTKTSYAAHLAGALAGFLVGIVVLRNLKVKTWEKVLGWFAMVIFILLIGGAIIFNVANEKHFYDYQGICGRPKDFLLESDHRKQDNFWKFE